MALEDETLTPAQLSLRWDKSEKRLANMRANNEGPSYFKDGHTITYRMVDILAYEEARLVRLPVKAEARTATSARKRKE